MAKFEKKVTEAKTSIYLKGIRVASAAWFRNQAKDLGYDLNEFFDELVRVGSGEKLGSHKKDSKKRNQRDTKKTKACS